MSHLPADMHRRLDVIDTGDHVRHGPTGEEWVVAYVEGERLAWCGWPPGLAATSDCTLLRKASAAERLRLLHEMAELSNDHRGSFARHALEQITPQAAAPSAERDCCGTLRGSHHRASCPNFKGHAPS